MDTPLTDDYVISMLQKDARSGKLGSSFTAERRDKNAPKPNTRFLRNLVRDADSHNSALLAKEKAERRARLEAFNEGEKRGRRDAEEGNGNLKRQRRSGEREGRWKGVLSGLGGGSRDDRSKRKGHGPESKHREREEKTRSHTSRDDRQELSHRDRHSHRRRHPRSRSRSPQHRSSHHRRERSRSHESTRRRRDRSRRRHKSHERSPHRDDDTSRSTKSRKPTTDEAPRPKDRSHDSASDSDPLESLVGPAPPPTSRPRGRGANANNRSTIDLRFNDPTYNPRADVDLSESEGEKDDWSTSLEAIRDRAAWREKGAQRLREAGFGEREVDKWEGSGHEKDERDLRWRSKGEGREWDAGKVAGDEGDVRVKAAWTKGLTEP